MKLSKITLSLIATGLHSIAAAVENMAAEAGDATLPSTAAVADKSEKVEQSSKDKSSGKASTRKEVDDEDKGVTKDEDNFEEEEEIEETADEKKKRLRKEKRQAKKAKEKAEAEAAAKAKEDDEDDSFLDDEDDTKITKDEVKKSLVALAKAEGNAAAKAILTKYKAANVSQIDEGDYEAVMTDIAEAQE